MKLANIIFVALAVMAWAVSPATGEIRTETVIYADGQIALEGYLAWDDEIEDRRPGILIVHEWWGVNDYVRGRARQLAAMGYVALAADIYGRGRRAETAKQARELSGEFKNDPDLLRRRARAGLDFLAANEHVVPTRIAAIGYCFGGTTVLELARSGADLAAVVSFHGGLGTSKPAEPGQVKARILVLHGGDDPHVSDKELQAFMEEMRSAGADWQVNVYGGAVHSFTNPDAGDDVASGAAYNAQAAHRSWLAMKLLLAETIGLPDIDRGQSVGEFFKENVATPVGKAGKATGKAVKKAYEWTKEKVTGD